MPEAQLNLIVIRSSDVERAVRFYELLGLSFEKHRHGNAAEHYACQSGSVLFKIYPLPGETGFTNAVRLGFRVNSVDEIFAALTEIGAKVISAPKDSQWGRRAVVADPDGHRIELINN